MSAARKPGWWTAVDPLSVQADDARHTGEDTQHRLKHVLLHCPFGADVTPHSPAADGKADIADHRRGT